MTGFEMKRINHQKHTALTRLPTWLRIFQPFAPWPRSASTTTLLARICSATRKVGMAEDTVASSNGDQVNRVAGTGDEARQVRWDFTGYWQRHIADLNVQLADSRRG